MNLKHSKFLLLFMVLIGGSCTSYKNVPYFQDLKNDDRLIEQVNNFSPLTIQNGDLLAIHASSLNPEADVVFNNYVEYAELTPSSTGSSLQRPPDNALGYMVDNAGDVNLPLIGLVHVAGSTPHEITVQIQAKLEKYLSKPIVNTRILNFKISVIGDVRDPGTYTVQSDRITLVQALSLAGDLNTTALRTNVLLIREADGNRNYIHLNLTSKNIFDSPYYYLKNNDVIYAVPGRARVQNESTVYDKVAIVLSGVSVILFAIKK